MRTWCCWLASDVVMDGRSQRGGEDRGGLC